MTDQLEAQINQVYSSLKDDGLDVSGFPLFQDVSPSQWIKICDLFTNRITDEKINEAFNPWFFMHLACRFDRVSDTYTYATLENMALVFLEPSAKVSIDVHDWFYSTILMRTCAENRIRETLVKVILTRILTIREMYPEVVVSFHRWFIADASELKLQIERQGIEVEQKEEDQKELAELLERIKVVERTVEALQRTSKLRNEALRQFLELLDAIEKDV